MTLSTLNDGNYGIFLIMGDAGFLSSTVTLLNPLPGGSERSNSCSGFRDWESSHVGYYFVEDVIIRIEALGFRWDTILWTM